LGEEQCDARAFARRGIDLPKMGKMLKGGGERVAMRAHLKHRRGRGLRTSRRDYTSHLGVVTRLISSIIPRLLF
jgi:hypothetical protein